MEQKMKNIRRNKPEKERNTKDGKIIELDKDQYKVE
jgi:hypothetical protein